MIQALQHTATGSTTYHGGAEAHRHIILVHDADPANHAFPSCDSTDASSYKK
jgi:hypothetical protein